VPGDGVQVLWPLVLGPIRGSYFLWTAQTLSAREAQDLGVVNEVLPSDCLQARADEVARQLLALPPLTRRYTRAALGHRIRRLLHEGVGYGLALEGISAQDLPNQAEG